MRPEANGGYDSHLRRVRLLPEVRINDFHSGYFLWIELPPGVDATGLYRRSLRQIISIAPGRMFSAGGLYNNYFRFNISYEWNDRQARAIEMLAHLIKEMSPV